MASVESKDFATEAAEVLTRINSRIEVVNVGGQKVMKLTAHPGWRWSTDVKPVVGTESCENKHIGVIVEGSISCRHDDGTEVTYSAGSAYCVEPGHDAWVEGDTPAVTYEFHGLWDDKA